ncbi:hypothetical protein [Cohnella fermenti]|uniref:N-acetyltransferase domain-containing protein n=1 Tax=Cohnella fermenti TaxID=2565925 RepID=A0A4S4BH38_9BACL|nr:hypothetical protein [Cohnella fermenti]THF72708.1 hypothetical protein E6C55_32195 [Cohnella fermenti]
MEPDHAAYVKFLIRHHDELNLPYSFPVKLSFFSSPLMFGQAILILEEDSYEIVGAAGYVLGTGAGEYEDRHICQIEAAYLREPYRGTTMFVRALRALLESVRSLNPDVRVVQFWTPADLGSVEALWSRWSRLPGAETRREGSLAFYSVPLAELERFCERYDRGRITTIYNE